MDELKAPVAGQMGDVVGRTRDQVVHRNHIVAFSQEPVAQVAAQETGAASHENTHTLIILFDFISFPKSGSSQ
jgi:hypothetical protein